MEKDASEKTSNLIKEDASFKDLQVNSNGNQHNVGGKLQSLQVTKTNKSSGYK